MGDQEERAGRGMLLSQAQFFATIYRVNQNGSCGILKCSTQIDKYILIVQQRIGDITQMSKKITDMRINKQVQGIEKEPIPCVLVHREDHLAFHFCFYGLEEEYKQGFYHGILDLPEDYPFSPPKIRFLTNNGRFEVGKSICTTFTHYHKETWSSSWNIRTILTAMISFMYTNEKGIGGLAETPEQRQLLAARSLQQNFRNEKFVLFFKEKLLERSLVTPERVDELLARVEKARRRKRERSETTHAEQVRDIPEILEKQQVEQPVIAEQDGEQRATVIFNAEECEGKKRGLSEREDGLPEEIAQLQIFAKKIKMDYTEERQEPQGLERLKTVQDNQSI